MDNQSMIERVARALVPKYNDPSQVIRPTAWDESTIGTPTGPLQPLWKIYIPQARAALAAMREPTKGMIFAGEIAKDNKIDESCDTDGSYVIVRSDIHEAIWSAMIEEALKE